MGHAGSLLLRQVRVVPIAEPATTTAAPPPQDVLIVGGRIAAIGEALGLTGFDGPVVDGGGRYAIPGLWDHHVHLGQVAATSGHLDLTGCAHPADVIHRVARFVAASDRYGIVRGFGFRPADWTEPVTTSALDAVTGDRPVVLMSADVHSGWLNTAAQRRLQVHCDGLLSEVPWFEVLSRLDEVDRADPDAGYRRVLAQAASRGVVGVTDLEFEAGFREWPRRFARGDFPVRVRASVWPDDLSEAIERGLRTGDDLSTGDENPTGPPPGYETGAAPNDRRSVDRGGEPTGWSDREPVGHLTMGPFKAITDGSLGSFTAWCHEAYGPELQRGTQNYSVGELTDMARRATRAGLEVAYHAIGDAAAHEVVAAMAAARARGTVEHAQLMRPTDIAALAAAGLAVGAHPAHLLDDRPVLDRWWSDRADRAFPFADLVAAGVELRFGSDAPVSPLNPWRGLAAAVHRGDPDGAPWHPEQRITVQQALTSSTNGVNSLAVGGPGDVVLVDADPRRPEATGNRREPAERAHEPVRAAGDTAVLAAHLLALSPVSVTVMDGCITHDSDSLTN